MVTDFPCKKLVPIPVPLKNRIVGEEDAKAFVSIQRCSRMVEHEMIVFGDAWG